MFEDNGRWIFTALHEQPTTRLELVTAIRERLRRAAFPRLQMLIVVTITGLSGFLGSVVLLHFRVHAMWLRYGMAVALAYGSFLLLLRLWMDREGYFADGVSDLVGRGASNPPYESGGSRAGEKGDLSLLDWLDFDVPDLEGLVILAFLVAIASALFACAYVVYSAPSLFAEVLVDGVLSAGLYRRAREVERPHWVQSVLRKTLIPFAIVALFFVVAGWVSQIYAPEATSIGGVLRHHSTNLRQADHIPSGLSPK
jgi:hypothetical protein